VSTSDASSLAALVLPASHAVHTLLTTFWSALQRVAVHTTLSAWLFCHPAAQVQVCLLSPFVHVDRPPQTTPSHSSMSAHAVLSPDKSSPAARVVPAAHAVHTLLLTCSSVPH
jgi:hypothetical protein